MEPRPGTRDNRDDRPTGLLDSAGRLIGFLLFAVPAMAILAALILLPAYKHYQDTLYSRECKRLDVQDGKRWIAANERLIHAATSDPVYLARLVMSQSPVIPANEMVVDDPENPSQPPIMIVPEPLPRPEPPNNKLLQYAARIENVKTRQGLFLVASGALLAALFLFSPGPSSRFRRSSIA